MTYEIYTNNATELINTIFTCCENKKDPQGRDINTWDVTETKDDVKVLIHTTNQWEKKCNLHLDKTPDNDVVLVSSRYWARFPQEEREGTELDYILGRFTELALVHFQGELSTIEIHV